MTSKNGFRLTRLAVLWFVVWVGAAMLAYPGGTRSDPSTHGYSLVRNPLSALGATVAGNGQSNKLSAALFAIGLTPTGAALVLFFVSLLPLYTEPRISLWLARAGCVAGIVAGVGYIGVALVPVNLHPRLHGHSAQTAFRAFLVASVLIGLATAWRPRFSRRAVVGWFSFAVLLAAFTVIGIVAPRGPTQVVAQKLIVLSTLVIVTFESYEAEHVSGSLTSG